MAAPHHLVMEFVGRLSAFPVAHILQILHGDRRTGVLLVRSGRREKWVSFREGHIVACVSEGPEELYSRFLLANGYLDPQTLVAALAFSKRRDELLGRSLMRLGILDVRQVRETLAQHLKDSVCGLFLWQDGSFYFEQQEVAEDELMPDPVDTMSIIMEGTRWLDEYRRICGRFVHENVLLTRGSGVPERKLTPIEQRVVSGVTSQATLTDLYNEIKCSYFRFLEATHRLVEDGVLEIGGWSAREEDLQKGAFEDPAEPVSLLNESQLEALAGLLPSLIPVWVTSGRETAPDVEELKRRLPEIDGRATIGEICAGGSRDRHERMQLLITALGRRRIALLPIPYEELETEAADGREAGWKRWFRR